jgi:beta-glucanase (GH16 family)
MKAVLLATLIAAMVVLAPGQATVAFASAIDRNSDSSQTLIRPTLSSDVNTDGLNLTFHDEFDSTSLDTTTWQTQLRWGRTSSNAELQYYAEDAFEPQSGILRVTAEKLQKPIEDHPYKSGVIASFDSYVFTFGYVEMKAKIPSGKGLWPGFWMAAYDRSSNDEIDIFEILGDQPNVIHNTLHYDGSNGTTPQIGHSYTASVDLSKDYHTYGLLWSSKLLIWYLDGVEIFRVTKNIPQKSMFVYANLAVGGDWPGNPDANTKFPASYDIDYIRVFQQS